MDAAELNATTMSNLATALEIASHLKAENATLEIRLANCDAKLTEAVREKVRVHNAFLEIKIAVEDADL